MMLTGLVPVVIVMVVLLTIISRSWQGLEEEKVSQVARQLGHHVGEVMDRSVKDLETLTTNPLLSDLGGSVDDKLTEMRRLVSVYEAYSDLSLYDTKGYLVVSTSEDHPAHREYSNWFKMALEGALAISQPQRRIGADGLFLTVFLPVRSPEGDVAQVIKARLSFDRVTTLLDGIQMGGAGEVLLLDAWGNTLCGSDSKRLMEKFDKRIPMGKWLTQTSGIYERADGKVFLYGAEALPKSLTHVDSHWVVLAMRPMEEVQAVPRKAQAIWAVATVAMILVALILGFFLSRNISLPLERIGHVARLVAGGELGVRAEGGGAVEIDQLATAFNQMVAELSEHRSGLEKLVLSRTESLRRSQSDLERTSARLQAAIDSTNNGFLVEDAEGEIAVANDLFLSLLGRTRDETAPGADGTALSAFSEQWEIPDGGYAKWEELIASDGVIDAEVVHTGASEQTVHVFSTAIHDHRGRKVGRVWTIQDLTEQRRLESSLRQSQKMEAVGQLAGGVAHDFNNLLTGILGNLALVDLDSGKGASPENQEHLRCAVRAGERAADLVKQLLGFSRRSRMDLKVCDANEVLTEVRALLAATIDPRIQIELALEAAPWRVMADLGLLSQVIMNMAVNSKDAMPGGGHLWFRSANRYLRADDVREGGDRREGDHVVISIEDDGEGISLDIQKRIFEPFFTTKEQGKGTGLGLATSFGIVKQLGGWIEMDSRPGEGTRFDIFLPRSAVAEAQPDVQAATILTSLASAGPPAPATETVLIVDDEDVVRRVAKTLLKKLGYQVIEARDGLEALGIFETRSPEIDLVLLDLTMPNLSGRETFRLIRERHGDVPVLICSGYLVDLTEFAEECGSCPEGFVQKPYRFEDLSAAIRSAIAIRRKAA